MKNVNHMRNNFLLNFSCMTLKDLDFIQLVQCDALSVDIVKSDLNLIFQTIERDLDFLKQNSLMDYSLLLGIEINNNKEDFGTSVPTTMSVNTPTMARDYLKGSGAGGLN